MLNDAPGLETLAKLCKEIRSVRDAFNLDQDFYQVWCLKYFSGVQRIVDDLFLKEARAKKKERGNLPA